MPSEGYQFYENTFEHPSGNPFVTCHPTQTQAFLDVDMEPISMIDEEEFARKFQDIALFADQDDTEEDAALLHATRTEPSFVDACMWY